MIQYYNAIFHCKRIAAVIVLFLIHAFFLKASIYMGGSNALIFSGRNEFCLLESIRHRYKANKLIE